MENRTSKGKDSIFSHSSFSKNSRVCALLYFSTPVLRRSGVVPYRCTPPPLHFAKSPEQSKGTGGGGAEVMRQIYYIKKKGYTPLSLYTYIPPRQYSSLPHCPQFGLTPRPSKKVNRRGGPRPPVGRGNSMILCLCIGQNFRELGDF